MAPRSNDPRRDAAASRRGSSQAGSERTGGGQRDTAGQREPGGRGTGRGANPPAEPGLGGISDARAYTPRGRTVLVVTSAALLVASLRGYPVAASGVSLDAELQMRNAAQVTLARYLFLTSDSGVGGEHAEPTIPCYQVQHLNKLMNRMIASELSGTRIPADPADIVRSVGDPVEGVCTLPDGSKAFL